jgi:hypothetical protein
MTTVGGVEGDVMSAPSAEDPTRTDAATAPVRAPIRTAALIGTAWALIGVVAILGDAIARVWPYTREALRHGLTGPQWVLLIAWVVVMVVAEGYRGFQKRFAPRVTTRGLHLLQHGRGIDLLLAPFYCIGYFHAPRRQIISSWSLTAGITLLIVIVRTFDQPWRGIVDAGVLAGLAYGLAAVLANVLSQSTGRPRPTSASPDPSR